MQLNMNDLPYQAISLPEEVKMYHYAGDFEGEITCIDRWLRRDIPHCLRKRLEIQRLFAEQLVDDYPLTRADVVRGVEMFRNEQVAIPVAGIIENMAYFTPEELPDNKYYIFGKGGARAYAEEVGVPFLGDIPIVQSIMEGSESGQPSVGVDAEVERYYREIAQKIVASL